MFFRTTYLARTLLLDFKCEAAEFQFEKPFKITATLRPPPADTSEIERRFDAACDVMAEREASDQVRSMFEGLARGELPKGFDRHMIGPGVLDESGKIANPGSILMLHCPKEMCDFADETFSEMAKCASRIVSVLRWRLNRPQVAEPVNWDVFENRCSLDGVTWNRMPSMFGEGRLLHEVGRCDLTVSLKDELVQAVAREEAEPLAHSLFREAWSLRFQNQKSSLLIGFSAAEVGIKQHIVRMVPETKFLITEMASPPIRKLLEYVDQIHSKIPRKESQELTTKPMRKPLHEMSELRNALAHGGRTQADKVSLTRDTLDDMLRVVRDLLWFLDYCAGHAWARGHVRPEMWKELAK